jgi:hypothetical protein
LWFFGLLVQAEVQAPGTGAVTSFASILGSPCSRLDRLGGHRLNFSSARFPEARRMDQGASGAFGRNLPLDPVPEPSEEVPQLQDIHSQSWLRGLLKGYSRKAA